MTEQIEKQKQSLSEEYLSAEDEFCTEHCNLLIELPVSSAGSFSDGNRRIPMSDGSGMRFRNLCFTADFCVRRLFQFS